MRKRLLAGLICALIFAATACGTTTQTADDTVPEKTEAGETEGKALPYGTDKGEGTVYLRTQAGTSEEGNIPEILADEDMMLLQIGLTSRGTDGAAVSYIYIDGKYLDKAQMGDCDMSIDLEGDALKEGEHTVSVVQYEDNDETREVKLYKENKYSIFY